MNLVFAWLSFGQFGELADPITGLRRLTTRLHEVGVHTMRSPYHWSDNNTIVGEVIAAPKEVKIVVGGASLGDNEAVEIANQLQGKRDIDLLFGFQRSKFGRQFEVPNSVIKAIEIHDPNLLSDPFGDDPWVLAKGNTRTILRNIPIDAPHPGDFGVAQDIVFNAIKQLVQGDQKIA
jgi:hypothetical protein